MLKASYRLENSDTQVYVGDCREVMNALPEKSIDLIFADPPFNWDVPYGEWDD
jgi:DNA modification methylase